MIESLAHTEIEKWMLAMSGAGLNETRSEEFLISRKTKKLAGNTRHAKSHAQTTKEALGSSAFAIGYSVIGFLL